MKARLLKTGDALELLSCNGTIKRLTQKEARNFLESFDNDEYYAGEGTWNYNISLEEYEGDTIAYVDSNGAMTVVNAKEFRCILREQAVEYLTPEQYAEKVGRKRAIVVRLCLNHRIPGARQVGARWIIPADAPYPDDARFGSRIKRYDDDL